MIRKSEVSSWSLNSRLGIRHWVLDLENISRLETCPKSTFVMQFLKNSFIVQMQTVDPILDMSYNCTVVYRPYRLPSFWILAADVVSSRQTVWQLSSGLSLSRRFGLLNLLDGLETFTTFRLVSATECLGLDWVPHQLCETSYSWVFQTAIIT